MATDKALSLEGAELLYNDIRARLVGISQGGGSGTGGGGGTGADGVGILSIVQTTTSTADKGENIITATLTDGRSSKFSVLNGSRGASGSPGTNGIDGKGIDSITVSETPADGGANRVTINMTDGSSKSFSVMNGKTGSAGPQGDPGKDATIDSSILSYAEDPTGSDAITDVVAVNGKLVFNRGKAFTPISHLTMSTNPHRTTAADVGAVPTSRTVNGKPLSSNIVLDASDVGASAIGHKHTKSDITDFPSSLPASDVYSWAKAASKPTYTASEVGAPPKHTYQTVSGTVRLSAMSVGEIKIIVSHKSSDDVCNTYLPSGGNYIVAGMWGSETDGYYFTSVESGSMSGGMMIDMHGYDAFAVILRIS